MATKQEKQNSLITLAWYYAQPTECKFCGLFYNKGYICMHCGKDNS